MSQQTWRRWFHRVPQPSRLRSARLHGRPLVELLETRLTPSITASVVNGALMVIGDNTGNNIVLDHAGSTTIVNSFIFPDSSFSSITVNMGGGTAITDIAKDIKPTTINVGPDTDAVNIGAFLQNENLDLIPANITVNFGSGLDTLHVLDQNSPRSRAYTLTADSSVGFNKASITRPGAGVISYSGMNQVELDGGNAPGNSYFIDGTENFYHTILNTGTANASVGVVRTGSGLLDISSGNGQDSVTLGASTGSVQGLLGAVNVTNANGHTLLTVNDEGNPPTSPHTNVLMNVNLNVGTISGLAPTPITYSTPAVNNVQIFSNTSSSIFNVLSTAAGVSTLITDLNGGTTDVLNVGNTSHGMEDIQGPLVVGNGTVNSTGSFINLNLDNSHSHTARNVTSTISNGFGTITGLAPATIQYQVSYTNSLNIFSSAPSLGNNLYTFADTGAGFITELFSPAGLIDVVVVDATHGNFIVNGGDDNFNVGFTTGPSAGLMTSILAPVSYINAGVLANLTFDAFAETGVTATFTNIFVQGLSPASVFFTGQAELFVLRIGANTTLNISSTPAFVGPGDLLHVLTIAANDTINVGTPSDTLDSVFFPVKVDGTTNTTLNIDDQNSHGHGYTITSTSVSRTPNPPGPVITFSSVSLVLNKGSATAPPPAGIAPFDSTSTVNVLSTASDSPVTINALPGEDTTVNVGDAADSLDGLQGAVTVNGGGGNVVLNVNDQATLRGQEYDLLQGELARTDAAPIAYTGIQDLVVNGGAQGNLFDVDGVSAGTPAVIDTGVGSNLVRMRQHSQIQDALTLNSQSASHTDKVGYVAYTTDVYVNFQTGTATDIAALNGFTTVTGGQGNNILVGDGTKNIIGGTGHNLIISGGGTGTLVGSGHGDILIGGTTAYDKNANGELQAILSEWTRTDLGYADIVNHILNGDDPLDPYPLNASTVFDNGAANTIIGGAFGQVVNLYYVTNNDTIADLTDGEVVINVSGAAPAPGGRSTGKRPGDGIPDWFFLQAQPYAAGVSSLLSGRTPLVTDDMAADLVAQAAQRACPQEASPFAKLAWLEDLLTGSFAEPSVA